MDTLGWVDTIRPEHLKAFKGVLKSIAETPQLEPKGKGKEQMPNSVVVLILYLHFALHHSKGVLVECFTPFGWSETLIQRVLSTKTGRDTSRRVEARKFYSRFIKDFNRECTNPKHMLKDPFTVYHTPKSKITKPHRIPKELRQPQLGSIKKWESLRTAKTPKTQKT